MMRQADAVQGCGGNGALAGPRAVRARGSGRRLAAMAVQLAVGHAPDAPVPASHVVEGEPVRVRAPGTEIPTRIPLLLLWAGETHLERLDEQRTRTEGRGLYWGLSK